jgi:hypothetical protein
MLHQFNEYTGQGEGHGYGPDKSIYVDSYSNELSDDLEPVSLTAPGFRGDQGGWGYHYINLTRALMDIYRGNVDDVTLLAVHVADSTGSELVLEWTTIGVDPDSFSVTVDGETMADGISELTFSIPMTDLSPGEHTFAVTANGVGTRYELSFTEFDVISDQLMPVVVQQSFMVK